MRAFATERFGELQDLQLRDLPRPSAGPGELLVRVHAAALNPADWKVLTGREGGRFLHAARFPLILGFDFSGVVEDKGSQARNTKVGDEVFGFLPYSRKTVQGSLADYVAVPEGTVALKPPGLSHIEAASVATVGSTALQGLYQKARLQPGGRVLIIGASGGVGSLAVPIAKNAGLEVWGMASASKADFVRERGADRVLDYRQSRIADLAEEFDMVFDAAAATHFGECSRILKSRGVYLTTLPSLRLLTGMIAALFSRKSCRMIVVQPRRDDLGRLAEWISSGKLQPVIDSTYPLEQVPEALRHFRSNEVRGKVTVKLVESGGQARIGDRAESV